LSEKYNLVRKYGDLNKSCESGVEMLRRSIIFVENNKLNLVFRAVGTIS